MKTLNSKALELDLAAEIERISDATREALTKKLRRRGLVVGISGGIDSAVCAALSVEAVGAQRVLGLLMPETDSSSQSTRFGAMVAENLGIEYFPDRIH